MRIKQGGLKICDVRTELAAVGIKLVYRHSWGEFEVNFVNGKPASAYFTDDLADARDTGLEMARSLLPVLDACPATIGLKEIGAADYVPEPCVRSLGHNGMHETAGGFVAWST